MGTEPWVVFHYCGKTEILLLKYIHTGYDDILGVIGPFGLWQKRSTIFLWLIIAFVGFPFLVYTFALAKPGTSF